MMRALILGIGDTGAGDLGFGIRCVERLSETVRFGPEVRVLECGAEGLYLLPFLKTAETVVVFDALGHGAAPGDVAVIETDRAREAYAQPGRFAHQSGFHRVVSTSCLMGYCPERVAVVACEPGDCGRGDTMTAPVSDAVDTALESAVALLAGLGIRPQPAASGRSALRESGFGALGRRGAASMTPEGGFGPAGSRFRYRGSA